MLDLVFCGSLTINRWRQFSKPKKPSLSSQVGFANTWFKRITDWYFVRIYNKIRLNFKSNFKFKILYLKWAFVLKSDRVWFFIFSAGFIFELGWLLRIGETIRDFRPRRRRSARAPSPNHFDKAGRQLWLKIEKKWEFLKIIWKMMTHTSTESEDLILRSIQTTPSSGLKVSYIFI